MPAARDICIMRMECVSSSFLSHLWREDRLVVCTSSPRVSHHRFLLSSTAKYILARQGSSQISHTVSTSICVVWCACVSIGNGSTFENYYIDIVHVTVFADLLHKNSIKSAILVHQRAESQFITRQTQRHTETWRNANTDNRHRRRKTQKNPPVDTLRYAQRYTTTHQQLHISTHTHTHT